MKEPMRLLRLFGPAAATGIVALSSAFGLSACSHAPYVQQPAECSEPCCGGDTAHVDCGNHPDLSCRADADPYSCLPPYGCVDGSFYPSVVPVCDAGSSGPGDAATE
jgi:hypothetical protein